MEPIDRFTGEHAFLSNFHPSPIWVAGMEFATVEHAFQALKSRDPAVREQIRQAPTPGRAKRLGRKVEIGPDWEWLRLGVMEWLLELKFSDPELRQKLRATGERKLIEGNHWGDTFWGVCRGEGENHLGRLLMKVRGEIT